MEATGARRPARVRLGSRRSPLALAQAGRVAARLRAAWPGLEVEIAGLETEGDRRLDRPLPEIGGKGLFTAALEEALRDGRIDAAVHSLKDLPATLPAGLRLACVPEREDPADALVARAGRPRLEELPPGSVVGTSSLRRGAQLAALRPDLERRPLRGNVETRIRACREGELDAVILAVAGLARLGLGGEIATRLEPAEWLPAPGQGALAVETREDDPRVARWLAAIEDSAARAAAECERALLVALEAGCQLPIGAWARREGGGLRLDAAVFACDGSRAERARVSGDGEPARLGREAAERLLARGAGELLGGARAEER